MKNSFCTWWKEHKWQLAALCLIAVVLCMFTVQKEGYHMDELLSFELSNAEYNPWIVPTQPVGRLAKFVHEEIDGETITKTIGNFAAVVKDVLENKGNSKLLTYQADVYTEPVWIGNQMFQDYITVGDNDAFNYLSVYFNVKDDNHPPLHFMLLHTISSLFRGQAEPFMGCIINLLAILGCCVFLMKIGDLLWQDKRYGIVAALLYGLSYGAVATQLLIRMYGVMTFFCVAVLYLHLKKWKNEDWKHNKALILVTVLGFWTQYFFLFYVLILAAVTAVCFLRKKNYKALARYVAGMVTAAVIGLVGYPFAISDVFQSGRGVEALEKLGNGFADYGARLAAFGGILFRESLGGFVGLLGLVAAVIFGLVYRRKKVETSEEIVKNVDGTWLSMLVLPPLGYFLFAAKLSPYLVDRYIMAVFPFAALLLGVLLVRLGVPFFAQFALCLLWMVLLVGYDGEYLYIGYEKQEATAAEYADYDCICVYDGVGYYENLQEFTQYKSTLLVTAKELADRSTDPILDSGETVVVLIKGGLDEEEIQKILMEKYGYSQLKSILAQSVYGDKLYLVSK